MTAAGRLCIVIQLHARSAHCSLSPEHGGRVASLAVHGVQLLVQPPDEADDDADDTGHADDRDPMAWGCYPMAPWAGRIRNGTFTFDGVTNQLPVNLAPHAIHGTVFTRVWHVDSIDGNAVTLSCELGLHWPFGGSAKQRIELHDDHLSCELSVTAADHDMPAQVGWHSWFVKPQSAQLHFGEMYVRDAHGIPTGEVASPSDQPWDDCFTNPLAPIELRYETPDHDSLLITVDSDCDHWVIYDQPAHATCVEPQSGPPDGFNIAKLVKSPRSAGSSPIRAGQTLRRKMTIHWDITAAQTPC